MCPLYASAYYYAFSYYYMCPDTSVYLCSPYPQANMLCSAFSIIATNLLCFTLLYSALLYFVPASEHSVELIEDNSVDRALK